MGSVLYVMVSGRPPFRAPNSVAVLKRVCEDTPRSIEEIIPGTPNWLCDIISRLHAKQPDDRFQTAKELADLLGQYLAHVLDPAAIPCPSNGNEQRKPIAAKPTASEVGPLNPPSKSSSPKSIATQVSLFVSVCALLLVLASLFRPGRPSELNGQTKQAIIAASSPNRVIPEIASSASKPGTWNGWPADAPARQQSLRSMPSPLRLYQESWAAYLNVPVGLHQSLRNAIPPDSPW